MTNSISPFAGTPESYSAKIERSPSQPVLVMQKPAQVASTNTQQGVKTASKSKPRKRVNTAEKRNQHNAIERQRRETLNGKFLSLARLLPSLASHRRPSKSAIVNGSISHLTFQRDQRLMASRLLRQLCADRDALAKECNEWRAANGFQPKDALSAWTEEMEEVCNVEKEVFGNFAHMQEDDGDDGDQDGQDFGGNDFVNDNDSGLGLGLGFNGLQARDMSLEQAAAVAAANVNVNVTFNPMSGLITPRSSTDMDMSQVLNKGLPQLPQTQLSLPQLSQTQDGGINWADFSFVSNNNNNSNTQENSNPLATSASSLPFSAFMSDSLSSSPSGCSPTGSVHTGNGIPTPPTSAELGSGFTHTPSPRSSHSQSGADEVQNVKPSQKWTEQQLLFLHSVQQQQLQQRQQAQASLLQQAAAQVQAHSLPQVQSSAQSFNPAVFTNSFSFMNGNGQHSANVSNGNNGQVMNLMASMFPQQSNVHVGNHMPTQPPVLQRAQTEQMDAWRRMTIASGMMRGPWEQSNNNAAVKGF